MADAALVYEVISGVAAVLLVAALLFVAVRRIKRKPATNVDQSAFELVNKNDLYIPEQMISLPTQVGPYQDEEKGLFKIPNKPLTYGSLTNYNLRKTSSETNITKPGGSASPQPPIQQTMKQCSSTGSETNLTKDGGPATPLPSLQQTREQCISTATLDSLDDSMEDLTTSLKHLTCIELTLVWVSLESCLSVHVTRLTNLPPKLCKQTTATITLTLKNATKELTHSANREHKGLNPEFNHTFTFSGVSYEEVKSSKLVFQLSVRRQGKLRRKPLGELSYSFHHANIEPDKPVAVTQPITPKEAPLPTPMNQAGYEEPDGGTPHDFEVHTYMSPTFCALCSNMLLGVAKQGIQCKACKMNIHAKCRIYARSNCSTEDPLVEPEEDVIPSYNIGPSHIEKHDQNIIEDIEPVIPHDFKVNSYKSPTGCAHCSAMLYGLAKQGMKCQACKMNIHIKCKEHIKTSCTGEKLQLEKVHCVEADAGTAHHFQTHNYKKPTFCALCGKMLKGLIKQGMQCQVCKLDIHNKCQQYAKANCIPDTSKKGNTEDFDVTPHQFQVHSYKTPTGCAYCSAMLYGLAKQGKQCQICKMNIHNKCEQHMKSSCGGEQAASNKNHGRNRLQSADGMSNAAVGEILVLLQYKITGHTQARVKVFIQKAKCITQGKGSDEYSVEMVVHRGDETVADHQTPNVAGPEPVWNAPFIFDVRQDQIKEFWVEFFLHHRGGLMKLSSQAIGRALVGHDTSPQGTKHWEDIQANMDKEITSWHTFTYYQDNS